MSRNILFIIGIVFIIYFVIKLLFRTIFSVNKRSVNSFNRTKEKTKYNNAQDAEFTEIKSNDSKKE